MSHLANVQFDPADIAARQKMKPFEYWNQYVRQEGEKPLTEEEFAKRKMAAQLPLFDTDVLMKAADQGLLQEMKDYVNKNSSDATTNGGESNKGVL